MSSDLLKEFGSPEENLWRGVASQSPAHKASADEDDFGDFEDPQSQENVILSHRNPSPPSNSVSRLVDSGYSGRNPFSVDPGYLQPSTHSPGTDAQDALSNDDDWGGFTQQSVMFDADMEATRQKSEADRWLVDGSVPKEPANILLHPTTSLKAFTPGSLIPAIIGVKGSQGSQEVTKARQQSLKYDTEPRVEASRAENVDKRNTDDEPWVDFETVEAADPGLVPPNGPSAGTLGAVEPSNLGPPPSNIPPPSILLPLIATLLGSLTANLKTVTSYEPLNQPNTLSQLRASLSITRAAARILAGRKLRWKRDNLLSQSMKIGPAHSGKAGGMKLAGVDKAESRREDQEAAEALQAWKRQAGPFRSTIATVNGRLPESERFKIPDIAENMPVRQGKASEGMATAPRCCFLCGIKRDERVAKIDIDVEDSFGEWWVEHWGHVDCVVFWENHKGFLRQR